MKNEGRMLVLDLDVDFSSTAINSTTGTNVGSALTQHLTRLDLFNTSSDCVKVYANGSIIAKVGPSSSAKVPVVANALQQLSLKSAGATLSAGKLFIAGYY